MLEGFFSPRTVAVIGASRDPAKVGHIVFGNLLRSGFEGQVVPVNPSAAEIDGHRCYDSILSVPFDVDLAILVVPASAAANAVDECGRKGTRAAILISAGFKETGPEGAALEREVVQAAALHRVRLLGPNCLGLIVTGSRLNASFALQMPLPGSIAFMSQSGALGTAILDWTRGEGIGLSHFVSLGNKADLTEIDLVRAWTTDDSVKVVAAYLESVTQGAEFVEAVSTLAARKPFIALKSGVSDAGARAVSSHTGSLAGSEQAYDAAFAKAGVLRVHSVQELFDVASAFASQPVPASSGLAIVTNAGGPAILATDACERSGIRLASLRQETITALREVLPPAAALYNPVDVLGDAPSCRYHDALSVIAKDPGAHSTLVILTPQATTQPRETADAIADYAARTGRTTMACFMGTDAVADGVGRLREKGIPAFEFPERAVAALSAMDRYERQRSAPRVEPVTVPADLETVRSAVDHALAAGRTFITEQSASRVVAAYGIRVPAGGLARDLHEALKLARDVGYPVVMKIASPDILHKSDIGGIRTDIQDESSLAEAYEAIMARGRAYMDGAVIWGVTVQRQVPRGREVIIGVNRDPQFGPLMMFGLGGVYVEVLKDVTFRLCPVTAEEARRMITEIRAYGLLRGVRGERPADTEAIADVITRISALVTDFTEVTELDINPLIVHDRGDGAWAADVRIGIGG